ncbi:hypothetical protein PMIN07_011183 [Paraphaeosphaeria minitans]
MLALSYLSAILVAVAPIVSANFDLNVAIGDVATIFPWPDQIGIWVLTDGDDPKCEDLAENGVIAGWDERNDLSHGREGMRCVPGSHCGYYHPDDHPWPSVELLEMHFTNNPLHHFTIYKDRGYTAPDGFTWLWPMYGVDGNTYGACHTDTRKNWDCNLNDDKLKLHGRRKFRCLTSITAKEINDAKRQGGKKAGDFEEYRNPDYPFFEVLSHNGTAIPTVRRLLGRVEVARQLNMRWR